MGSGTSIDVRSVSKSFTIPEPPSSRAGAGRFVRIHPRRRSRELEVLRDISFHVREGEFFGIAGRNGSGKSTLLKLLASIYRADRGTIRVAGRLAPFVELGVGFNPELPALDNVVLNGTMMGLGRREARSRYEAIVEFAGLESYTDLKLKNYSSGMKVRLGFAIMTHVDADVLLIDEVLAVGDAEFQEKCGEVFRRMHEEGRTVVLVTHSMPAISLYCERAMLLHDGDIDAIGEPDDIANRYVELNMSALAARNGDEDGFPARTASALADPAARVSEAWLDGARHGHGCPALLGRAEQIDLHVLIDVRHPIADPRLWLRVQDARGQIVFTAGGEELGLRLDELRVGERVRARAVIENRLAGGSYVLSCAVLRRGREGAPDPAGPAVHLRFTVAGPVHGGTLALDPELSIQREPATPEVEATERAGRA